MNKRLLLDHNVPLLVADLRISAKTLDATAVDEAEFRGAPVLINADRGDC